MKFGYKLGREFARRMQCYDGEFVPGHPEFPEGSEATVHTSAKPVPVGAPRIKYTAEDDKALEAGIRKLGQSYSPHSRFKVLFADSIRYSCSCLAFREWLL